MLVKTDRQRDLDYERQAIEALRRALTREQTIHARIADVMLDRFDAAMLEAARDAVEAWEASEWQRQRLHDAVARLASLVGNGYLGGESVALLREAIGRVDQPTQQHQEEGTGDGAD